jgi:hypothetical protein
MLMAALRFALLVGIFARWVGVLDAGVDQFAWDPMVLSRKVDGMEVERPVMV